MTRFASALPLLALLSAAPLAAQAARDFQLPPAPTPTADTRVQGPVDTDAPVPVRPRAIETARPAPTPTPTPTANALPTAILPAPATSQPPAQSRAPTARPIAPPPQTAGGPDPDAAAAPASPPPAVATGAPLALPPAVPSRPTAAPAARADAPAEGSFAWPWLAAGGLVLAAGAALAIWRRRSAGVAPPEFIVPNLSAAVPKEALTLAVDAVRMDRSMMNATVGYRVTLRNRSARALAGIAIEADLVSASRDRPTEQQLASPDQALTPRHHAERLPPGGTLRFEGEARLPLSEASAIWQGRVGLLVPLLRVRATAEGAAAVATTLVIGRAEGSTARPQPFRLDEPPRSYAPLAQRVLDAIPAPA